MDTLTSCAGPVLVLGDLDDTLFQTRRKCPAGREVFPVAFGRAGEALSFATAGQRRLFAWLTRDAEFVPVTGRNRDALGRVELPFGGHAITSFGGVIVTAGGGCDPGWRQHVCAQAAGCRDTLEALRGVALATAACERAEVRATVVHDDGIPLYLSLKHERGDAVALARLVARLAAGPSFPAGWRTQINDNNAACLPPWLGKERAVRYFLDRIAPPGAVTIGFGDSHGDAPFLSLCDYSLVPAGSQLGGHLHAVRAYACAR